MFKQIATSLVLASSLAGCSSGSFYTEGMSSGPYRTHGLGKAVALNFGQDPSLMPAGAIFPGMIGKWSGLMENNDEVHSTRRVMIYISGSTKKTGLKKDDLSILSTRQSGCTLGLVYQTTLEGGVVIYKKMTSWNGYKGFCGSGYVRVTPQNDGTLRISDHENSAEGREMSAGIFSRLE